MKKVVENVLDYTLSPQEDMRTIRQINFFYALGFNASSAALQFVTLPVFTLTRMTQFNGNYLRNAKNLTKWSKASGYFLKQSWEDRKHGILRLDFDNDQAWTKIQKDFDLNDEQLAEMKEFAIEQMTRGKTAAASVMFSIFGKA